MHWLPGRLASVGAALGAVILLAHCGGSDLTLPRDTGAAGIVKFNGDNQRGLPGSALAESLAVKVTDREGGPVSGLRVTFSLDTDAPGAEVSPTEARTGGNGLARARWVLGTSNAAQAVVAQVAGSNDLKVRFEAFIQAGDAARMESVGGDGQRGTVGTALGDPLTVRITDQFGSPVAHVSVEWDGGEGSVDPVTSETGDDGQASTTWTLGSSTGAQSATATSGTLDGSPVTFSATAAAGSANRLIQVSGNNQSAKPGAELGQPLVVRLLDRQGNGVAGRAVTWVVGMGGGRAGSSTSTTNAAGQASTHWTLGSAGTNTLNAVVSGVGVVGFTATARSESGGSGGGGSESQPVRLAFREQPSDTREGKKISPAVQVVVLDAKGNRFTGREFEVKLELTGDHDGRLGGDRTERTRSGVATFSDLSVGRRGTYRLHATAEGLQAADSDRFDVHSKHGDDGGDD